MNREKLELQVNVVLNNGLFCSMEYKDEMEVIEEG